jgi:hypothetical protein
MPAYVKSPFKPPVQLLTAGLPSYVWGSYDDKSSPTVGYIISDSASALVGTVTFQITSGPVPQVGEKIAVRGATRSANLNVSDGSATVISVVASADAAGIQDGVVTVTYPIASTTLGSAADSGQVVITRIEVGETAANGASVPVAVPYNPANTNSSKLISASVSFSNGVTGALVVLQGSNFDVDEQYVTLGNVYVTSVSSSGEFESNYRFYRLVLSGLAGSGTIVGKIEL